MIRLDIEGNRPLVLQAARQHNVPVLVSANSLWSPTTRIWRTHDFAQLDVALDSGRFVAMQRYGGFRWTPAHYIHLARRRC